MSGEAGTGLDVERLVDLWPRIRQDVKAVNRRIEALLSSIDPALVDGERITLAAAYEFHRDKLNTDEVRVVVEEAIARVVGRRVRVWCLLRGEAGLETPAVRGGDGSAGPPLVATVASAAMQVSREIGPPHAVEESPNGESDAGTEVIDADERRIQAAKNIFDAEEIDQDG